MAEQEPTQEVIDEGRLEFERIFGPATGSFVLDQPAASGDHPDEVKQAWVGVPLPVRPRLQPNVDQEGRVLDKEVRVYCFDGFNALVDSGTSEEVLVYWMDLLNRGSSAEDTFVFQASDGTYREAE